MQSSEESGETSMPEKTVIMPSGINLSFERLSPSYRQVGYVLLTRAPVASNLLLDPAAPRLACVKPVASVHPEPGSNSSL